MKYIKYILILIIVIYMFNPALKTHATDQTGTCITTLPNGEKISQPDLTLVECTDVTDANNLSKTVKDPVNWTSSANYYQLLAPLPCEGTTPGCILGPDGKLTLQNFDPTQANNLGVYLNIMIKIFIGICAVLSVVMIVMGGLEYMTSELISSKEAGKEKIRDALLGLVIALGAYALLFTINPNLLNTDINTCTPPQVLTNGACVTPLDYGLNTPIPVINTCTPPKVLTNGACVVPLDSGLNPNTPIPVLGP